MQFLAVAALLFVARVAAEQPQEVSNVQPVQAPVVGQPQSGPVSQAVPVSVEQQQQGPQPVVHHYSPSGQSPYPVEHQTYAGQYVPQQAGVVSQYSPSGMVQVVSAVDSKPYVGVGGVQGVRHYAASGPVQMGGSNSAGVEQYGQPEPAGMPPNYKPFGSWGLYIGGNPADGYYSNYYKALSNSVDKQQVSGVEPSVKPGVSSGAGVNQASAFGPMLKQASYPYSSYQDQVYPFDYYTTADLNSGSRVVSVDSQPAAVMPSTYSASGRMSPVQMGAQMYGSPVGSDQSTPSVYADSPFGASKRSTGKQDSQVQQQVQTSGAKGFAQKRYGYAYSPAAPQYGSQQQPQVFAYPVPVGSQIVGSQPGVEGAFQPYGVHGYTRYAIKPTVVASEQQSYYGVQSSPQYPVYKQYQQHQQHQQYPVVYQQQQQQHQQAQQAPVQQHAPVAAGQAAYQPLGFYGYPLSQLHYSQGSIVPAFQSSVVDHQQAGVVAASPVAPGVQVEAASSDKSESEVEKPTQTGQKHQHHSHQQQQKQQKRA